MRPEDGVAGDLGMVLSRLLLSAEGTQVLPENLARGIHLEQPSGGAAADQGVARAEALRARDEGTEELLAVRVGPARLFRPEGAAIGDGEPSLRVEGEVELDHAGPVAVGAAATVVVEQ